MADTSLPVADPKKPWLSKTVWVGVLLAASAFVPSVHDWIAANVDMFSMIVGGLMIALRMVSSGKISFTQ